MINDSYNLDQTKLSISSIFGILESKLSIKLDESSIDKVQHARTYLEEKLKDPSNVIYGVNTGFGSLCNTIIENKDLPALQHNLIRSHACGMGDLVPIEISRLILLTKIKNLSYGFSGVRIELINALISLYNQDIIPVMYQLGSLGASGDLAPLAHLSLPLIGEGKVFYKGQMVNTRDLAQEISLPIIHLEAKEGLSLLNGTQFSLSYGLWCCHHAQKIMDWATKITCISAEAYHCMLDPYLPQIHRIRNHNEQQEIANKMVEHLQGSEIMAQEKIDVQDPYSFRCAPQVLGASLKAIKHVVDVFENELNAVTDNPNIFPDDDLILSGGNFHAQPLALTLDYLAIALAEIANISERRVFKLVNGNRGLPSYLSAQAGLESGFMIAQYTAASIVSQNKQLCTPSSIDSISSSKGQEDHVSMAANAATKCYKVVENVYRVLAIELMVACQGIDYRKPLQASKATAEIHKNFRNKVPSLTKDRVLHNDMVKSTEFLMSKY